VFASFRHLSPKAHSSKELQMGNVHWADRYSGRGWGWFILSQRHARGEITHAGYAQMKSALSSDLKST
jgi:hypothetical protein